VVQTEAHWYKPKLSGTNRSLVVQDVPTTYKPAKLSTNLVVQIEAQWYKPNHHRTRHRSRHSISLLLLTRSDGTENAGMCIWLQH
jgi:hypothetical protein